MKANVVLNGKFSSWADVNGGVPHWSILRPLLLLMYINGLTNDLSSNAKFFDTSMFFVVSNLDASAEKLNDNLAKVQDWTLQR